jgi:hypothetical protein
MRRTYFRDRVREDAQPGLLMCHHSCKGSRKPRVFDEHPPRRTLRVLTSSTNTNKNTTKLEGAPATTNTRVGSAQNAYLKRSPHSSTVRRKPPRRTLQEKIMVGVGPSRVHSPVQRRDHYAGGDGSRSMVRRPNPTIVELVKRIKNKPTGDWSI